MKTYLTFVVLTAVALLVRELGSDGTFGLLFLSFIFAFPAMLVWYALLEIHSVIVHLEFREGDRTLWGYIKAEQRRNEASSQHRDTVPPQS